MKLVLNKIFKFEIDKRVLTVIMILAFMVIVFPVARIMMYCVPWYDDFSYGKYVKDALENNNTILSAIQGAILSSKTSYYSWQGTFTSCFFMSLMPAVWGTDKYVIGLWLVLAVFVLGIVALLQVLLRDVLKADRWSTVTVQAVVAGACVLLYRSPIEGLFWYDAAVHYTAMHGFGLCVIALVIKAMYTEKKILRGVLVGLSIPLAFFAGGANYITILQMGVLVWSVVGWGLFFKKKSTIWAVPAAVAMTVGILFNVLAPGNNHRMAYFVDMKTSAVDAVLQSFVSAFEYFGEFTGLRTWAIVILLLPTALLVVSKSDFKFRYPGLVALWSFCVYATGFTSTLYTMGHTQLSRATSIAHFTFQLLLFFNVFYLAGWVCRYLREKKEKTLTGRNYWWFYGAVALTMLGIFIAEPNKGGVYTTYVSYYFVHTGEAYNYYQEYLERVELCELDTEDVIVRPYVYKPWVLCLGDLSSDPNYEPNKFMAAYFGKNSIVCLTPEEEMELWK